MKAIYDNALPPELFQAFSSFAMQTTDGEEGILGFEESEEGRIILGLAEKTLGPVRMLAAFVVRTQVGGVGSLPHLDHGQHSAVFHCNPEWDLSWGGEFFFLSEDMKTIDNAVEFRPNRLVVWDSTTPHLHRPPTASASSRDRVVLVTRYESK